MTLSLTIDEPRWQANVQRHLDALGGSLIPVVKGNGYGIGRRFLAEYAAPTHATIAVGTIYETVDVTDVAAQVLVLTPTLDEHLDGLPTNVTLTVGSTEQIRHLVDVGWHGPVVAKIASSMLRHGLAGPVPDDRLDVVAYAIHPPLAGSSAEHLAEIEQMTAHLPADAEVHVSHLGLEEFAELARRHPRRSWKLRLGTALWHGDKSALHLGADVLDVRPVAGGTPAGYRLNLVPSDGHLVIIGAGSAHGVVPLADGRSPFHFARRRLELIEGPHMHVSMAFVATGSPCPQPGDVVDVQRPLISVTPDRVVWTR